MAPTCQFKKVIQDIRRIKRALPRGELDDAVNGVRNPRHIGDIAIFSLERIVGTGMLIGAED